MPDITYNEAILEINECLEEKNPKSTRGILHFLNQYKRRHVSDETRVRAVDVMIKYYERQDKSEKFSLFLKEKAKVINKKVDNLTPEDYERFKRDFLKLEESQKQEQ